MKFAFNKKDYEKKFLTPGGYIGKIKTVVIKEEIISVVFDIAEGEFKDIYTKEYQKNGGGSSFDLSKWNKRGIVNFDFQYVGAKYAFAQLLNDLEASNQSFKWKDETNDLKNMLIGVIYRKNTYEDKFGDTKVGTDFPMFTSTKVIADNAYSIEEKQSKNKTSAEVPTDTDTKSKFDISLDDIQF